jgi:hypothetical protein
MEQEHEGDALAPYPVANEIDADENKAPNGQH